MEKKNLTKNARNLRLEIFLSLVITIVRFKRRKREKKMFNKTTHKFILQALFQTNTQKSSFLSPETNLSCHKITF